MSPSHNQETLEILAIDGAACIIVATIGFGMGMDVPNIKYSINLGIPETCDALVQQNGRAGRDLVTESFGITYIEPSVYAALKDRILPPNVEPKTDQSEAVEKSSKSKKRTVNAVTSKGTKKQKRGKVVAAAMGAQVQGRTAIDKNLMRMVEASMDGQCLEAEKNSIYGNAGQNTGLDCLEANRAFPCSSCKPFVPPTPPPAPSVSMPLPDTAIPEDPVPQSLPALPPSLSRKHRQHALSKLKAFQVDRWALKQGPYFRYVPSTAFWTPEVIDAILNKFHLIRARSQLDEAANTWEFLSADGDALFQLIVQLNERYDQRNLKAKVLARQKAAATRARTAAAKRARQFSMFCCDIRFSAEYTVE
ncbi:hypothetical protein H0H92_009216 [Tricholoma furcatifolium]|nr:hypothetical protein H0H92_009216 [Tricholoma furcatifolium]